MRILSTKLLKTREQLKKKNKGKKSILGQIGDLKSKNKENIKKLEHHKGVER